MNKIFLIMVFTSLFLSCSQGGSGGGSQAGAAAVAKASATTTGLTINPAQAFSGFNGRDLFQVPFSSSGGTGIVWTSDRPSLITLKPNPDGTMMATTNGPGTVVLKAVAQGGSTATVTMVITPYTTADWDSGHKRYTTQIPGETQPCANCHGPSKSAPDHTPSNIANDNDAIVKNSYTTGVDPDGNPLNGGNHQWRVSNPIGILAYLRSLPPKGYPSGN